MRVDISPDKNRPGYFTVTPYGSIDSESYAEFQKKMSPLLVKSTAVVLIDLENVDYISSAGLGVFFTVKKFMKEKKGELLFCNLKPQIKRLFEIVKALPKDNVFADVEEADRYFYKMMEEEIEKEKKKSS